MRGNYRAGVRTMAFLGSMSIFRPHCLSHKLMKTRDQFHKRSDKLIKARKCQLHQWVM